MIGRLLGLATRAVDTAIAVGVTTTVGLVDLVARPEPPITEDDAKKK